MPKAVTIGLTARTLVTVILVTLPTMSWLSGCGEQLPTSRTAPPAHLQRTAATLKASGRSTADAPVVSVVLYSDGDTLRLSAALLPQSARSGHGAADEADKNNPNDTDMWCAEVIGASGQRLARRCALPTRRAHLPPNARRQLGAAHIVLRQATLRLYLPWQLGARLQINGLGQRIDWTAP